MSPSSQSIDSRMLYGLDVAARAETRVSSAAIVRSFIPKGADEESRAVAYALMLAANAVERGHR